MTTAATTPEPDDDLRRDLESRLRLLPADAVASGLTAARLHGLWLPPGARHAGLELSTPGRDGPARLRHHSRLGEVRNRRRDLTADEVVVVGDVATTSLPRTWVDLGEELSIPDLVAAGDCALRSGATLAELDEAARRAGHRRGVRRVRAALPLLDARSRSRPESCLRVGLVSWGLPAPDVNEPVVVHGEWIGEPDLSYREQRLGLEYQGEDHARLARMRSDITRGLSFGEVDWLIVPAGPSEVFRFPDRILRHVTVQFVRRGGRRAATPNAARFTHEWRAGT